MPIRPAGTRYSPKLLTMRESAMNTFSPGIDADAMTKVNMANASATITASTISVQRSTPRNLDAVCGVATGGSVSPSASASTGRS